MQPLIIDSSSIRISESKLLVSNLPPTTAGTQGYSVQSNQWLCSSFTTGSGSYGYTINSVTLRLVEMAANPNLFVRLHSDSSGSISSLITSFTNPSFTPNITRYYTFTPTTPQTLAANTAYWLVAGISAGSGQYIWAFTTATNEAGLPGWSISDNSLYSYNQGGTWHGFDGPVAFQFSVTGAELL